MLLEPPFPRGRWRPPDDGRAGPVINTTPPQTTPHNHWGPVMGPLEGRVCQVPDRGSARSPFPCPFLSMFPSQSLAAPAPERGAVLPFFGWGKGRERGGSGMPQGDGLAPAIPFLDGWRRRRSLIPHQRNQGEVLPARGTGGPCEAVGEGPTVEGSGTRLTWPIQTPSDCDQTASTQLP